MAREYKGGRDAAQKRYRENNAEKLRERKRAEYQRKKEYYQKKSSIYRRDHKEKVVALNAKWQSERRFLHREQVVTGYGHKCICCGESETLFLEIHHPNRDGKADRARTGGNTYTFYKWLIENNFPKGYDLLCANCHRAIHQSKDGICPHKKNQ